MITSVGEAGGQLKVVGSRGCFDNTKLSAVVPVEWLTWVLYA